MDMIRQDGWIDIKRSGRGASTPRKTTYQQKEELDAQVSTRVCDVISKYHYKINFVIWRFKVSFRVRRL